MAGGIRPPNKSPHSSMHSPRQAPWAKNTGPRLGETQDIQQQEPLVSQIMRYLRRLKHTLPMPCGPDATYFGLVPEQIEKWFQKGLFSEEAPLPGKAGNLLHTMLYTFESQSATGLFNPVTARHGILHVSVESQELYVEAMRGARGHEMIFWTQVPQLVPLPRNSVKTPFWLPPEHPHYHALREWHESAFALQAKIEMAKACMGMLDTAVGYTSDLRKAWPEIMSFVHFRNEIQTSSKRTEAQRLQLLHNALQNFDMKGITDLLATATLLPDKPPHPLRGWAGFFVQEG